MRYIFKFPDIGEGLDEGRIVEWYIEKGQLVESGTPLVKMETDKVVTDIPSPKKGRIAALYGKVGDTINVGSPLVEIEMEGIEGVAAIEEANKIEPLEEKGAGVVGTLEIAGNNAFLPASNEGLDQTVADIKEKTNKRALATPVARAMAKELNININLVNGTGPAGRVTITDIKKYQSSFSQAKETTAGSISETEKISYEPLTQLRKTIAKNMLNSKHNAAHMSVFEEVEVSELVRIRNKYKSSFEEKNVKLSYLPFIIKAVTLALKKHKSLNSQLDLDNERMIYKNYYNIGIAVDTDDGLVVPVIKDTDKISIFQIAKQLNEISIKARERKLKLEDMKDGTFTITNYGSIGGLFAVPVINYPQAAILGIGRMFKKPVIINDKIETGTIIPLSISVDHRIVDGGEVTRFVNDVMTFLNDPVALLMNNE
ncbi:MAG: 2-oxo acid dehydrogenase subunit E2 [Bacteroidales bacterium]|nr:2-oxo acid dehydrogenase subunit E2 [Bacteroidales bacterium]